MGVFATILTDARSCSSPPGPLQRQSSTGCEFRPWRLFGDYSSEVTIGQSRICLTLWRAVGFGSRGDMGVRETSGRTWQITLPGTWQNNAAGPLLRLISMPNLCNRMQGMGGFAIVGRNAVDRCPQAPGLRHAGVQHLVPVRREKQE